MALGGASIDPAHLRRTCPRAGKHTPRAPPAAAECPHCHFPGHTRTWGLPAHRASWGCCCLPAEPPHPRCAHHGCGALPCALSRVVSGTPKSHAHSADGRAQPGGSAAAQVVAAAACTDRGGPGRPSASPLHSRPGPHGLSPLALERPALNPGPAEAELCGGGSPRRVGAGPCAAAQPTPALRGPATRAWTPGRRACPGSCWPLRVAVSAFPGRQCHVAVLGGGVHAPRALLWAGGFRLRRQPRRPALPSHVVPFEALGDARVLCGPRCAQGEGSAGVFTTHS